LSSKRSATSFDYLLTRCVVVINEQDIVLVQLLETTEEKPDSQALAGLYEAMQGDCDLFASGNSVYGKLRTGVNVATDKNSARSVWSILPDFVSVDQLDEQAVISTVVRNNAEKRKITSTEDVMYKPNDDNPENGDVEYPDEVKRGVPDWLKYYKVWMPMVSSVSHNAFYASAVLHR